MPARDRRRRSRLAALGLGLALAASAGAPSPRHPDRQPVTPPPSAVTKIAVAYDISGRGDGGFNDLAYNGAKQAADELRAELKEVTAKLDDTDDDRAERLRLLAGAGYEAIIAVGFTYAGPMQTVAAEFPNVHFAIVDDGTVDGAQCPGDPLRRARGLVPRRRGRRPEDRRRTRSGSSAPCRSRCIQKFEAGYTAGVQARQPGRHGPGDLPQPAA